jgi:sugar lactone lactonase YvrE
VVLSGNRETNEVVASSTTHVLVSNLDAKAQGLGGFELSAHHVFDPATGTIYKGDGMRRYVGDVRRVETIAGGGALPVSGVPTASGSVALGAPIFQINSGAYGPDGSFYFAESSVGLVRRVTPAGILETVAGSGITLSDTGDGGPAVLASMAPTGVAVAPDGSVYIADSSHRRVRVVKNGIIQAFAGTGATGYGGDGGPAASAIFGSSLGALAVSGTGTVYIAPSASTASSPRSRAMAASTPSRAATKAWRPRRASRRRRRSPWMARVSSSSPVNWER